MENRINQLMCLADGRKYAIVKQAVYRGTNYFVAARVTEDEEDVLEEFEIFEEIENNGERSVQAVKDAKLVELIARHVGLYEG